MRRTTHSFIAGNGSVECSTITTAQQREIPDRVFGHYAIGVEGRAEKAGAPCIGDNVYIAPGARVFGRIRAGNNVKIGANAVVYKDVPDNAVVALDPGFRVLSLNGNRRLPPDRAA